MSDRNRSRYGNPTRDHVKADFDASANQALQNALERLVKRFGYSGVKNALLNLKRKVDRSDDGKAADDLRFQLLQHIWLAVQTERNREVPPLAVREACRRIAKSGGIARIKSADFAVSIPPRFGQDCMKPQQLSGNTSGRSN